MIRIARLLVYSVIVCGSREWSDYGLIRKRLKQLPKTMLVIEGDCRGADRIAGEVAASLGLQVTKIPAQWARYGKAAGPKRNQEMLDLKPVLVIAFHDDFDSSKGTKDMVTRARRAKIVTEVISHHGSVKEKPLRN